MNYSAAVIPVTKADKSIDLVDSTYEPIDDYDLTNWIACKIPAPKRNCTHA